MNLIAGSTVSRPKRPARRSRGKRLPARMIGLLLALAGVAGCGRRAPVEASDSASQAASVTLWTVPAPGGGGALILPARVKSREEATVTAPEAGRVSRMLAREGAAVREGEVLVMFDAPEARQDLEAARQALGAATIRQDFARRQEARMDSLYALRVAALRELEEAQVARRAADAAAAAARAAVARCTEATHVTAPLEGIVVRLHVDAGASVSAGQPLLDLRSRDAGEVVASLPESDAGRVASAQARCRHEDDPWRRLVLDRLDGMTDYASRTRVAHFRIQGPALPAGSYVQLRLDFPEDPRGPAPRAIHIPGSALVRRGELRGAYVVRDGRAWLRWLKLGGEDEDGAEVLAGLAAGEVVALDPGALSDGRAVRAAQ